MTERRIEISGHLRNLKPFIIAFALTLAPCLYFYYTDQDTVILYIGLGFGALYAIPTLIVHTNYYNHDKGKYVLINLASKSMQIDRKHIRQTINFIDIESIILTRGISGYRTILHKYFYFQFKLKNNEVIYLLHYYFMKMTSRFEAKHLGL